MTIYGMHFVASEDVVCILERITTVQGFCTSDKIYTKSPKTKKIINVFSIVYRILHLPFFFFFPRKGKLY